VRKRSNTKPNFIALWLGLMLLSATSCKPPVLPHTSQGASSETTLFFIGYRSDKTIELWQAGLEENSQFPVYVEPAKFPFDLLPEEEQFFLGNCKLTGECELALSDMPSQYWWDSLNVSPKKDKLLWLETAEFCPPHLGYCDGGMTRIVLWEVAKFDKKVIAEMPYHISLLTHQTITSVQWSPNNQDIGFIEKSKEAGWSRLKVINTASLLTSDLAENVLKYKWSPLGNRIAYIETGQELKIIDKLGQPLFEIDEKFENITDFTWSPDENKVVFSAITSHGTSAIYAIDLLSGKASLLLEAADDLIYTNVMWSPRGTEIAVVQKLNGNDSGQIFFINTQKSFAAQPQNDIVVQLDQSSAVARWEWSPDGEALAVQTTTQTSGSVEIVFLESSKNSVVSKFTQDNSGVEWMFTADGNAILVLLPNQDITCPKGNLDTLGFFDWRRKSFSELILNPILANDLKNCTLSISSIAVSVSRCMERPCP